MIYKLLLLFILVPLVELILLLMFAQLTGHFIWSVLLVLVTGAIGAWLARMQGVQVIQKIRQQLASGTLPTESLLDGALILIAGAFLLTPGVLTDAAGMSMLIPQCRAWYKTRMINWFKRNFRITVPFAAAPMQDGNTIDSYAVDSSQSSEAPEKHQLDQDGPGKTDPDTRRSDLPNDMQHEH